ncbi:MAG: protein kinase [Acidobacteriota bacterium]
MADPTEASRFRLSLGARIFLATAAIVTTAVAIAVAVTYFLGNQIADQAVRETLRRSSLVQSAFKDSSIDRLLDATSLHAGDTEFAAYIAEAVAAGDRISITDSLSDFARDSGVAFALAVDPDGYTLAQVSDDLTFAEDLSQEPLYLRALDEGFVGGVWTWSDRLFYVAAVPIVTGQLLQGFLFSGEAIDDSQAQSLRSINGTEVTFILAPQGSEPSWVATTLDNEMAQQVLEAVAARPGLLGPGEGIEDDDRFLEIELRNRQWLTLVRPLEDVAGRTLGAAANLASLEVALDPYRRIIRIFGAVGLAAILLASLVSYLLPRRVLQPMRQLAGAAKAAAGGDYDQAIAVDSSDEVGQLASAFSTLLSELREKRDMEIYVSELTRNLPDQEGGAAEAVPAAANDVTILGLEIRDYNAEGGAVQPNETLETLTLDLRRISRVLQKNNGKVESVLGHRLVASFEGHQRAQQALAAAAEIISREAESAHQYTLAIALVSGAAVTGTITWDNKPEYVVTGWPMEHLEGLLRVARSGTLLFSKSTYDQLAATFAQASLKPQEHRSTVSKAPLFSVSADSIRGFSGPEMSATLEMTTEVPQPVPATTLSRIGPGSVLGDRFEVLSELGAGGMGVVYKARDRTLDELVALKMLKQDVYGDVERLERLKDELKLARKISHPNVLRTFDFGEADGFPFISMEYVRGITLKHLLDQSGRLPLSAGLRLARQLCRGLWAAHSQAVLHRDIKPENLIIEPNGNAKLMDFGIARPIQRGTSTQTQPGTLIGTPFYLAPEQLEGQEPDQRADIYACGVVFYEIFTGTLPYPSTGNIMDIIRRKMNEDPAPPTEHWPTMPHTLEDIILRCLERDREQRFGNAESLLKELEILRA